jgi:hypothetical protein
VDATVIWGDPIAFDATSDRKRAAVEIEEAIRTAIRTVLRGRAS